MTEDFGTRHVLVADDDVVARNLAQLISNRLGVQCETAPDGESALRLLEEGPYEVLLTDMLMPGTHGLELLREVVERYPSVSVLVMTGYPSEFPCVEVIRAGASDFIAKPYHAEELEAKLVRLFRERALREEHARERGKIMYDLENLREARQAQTAAEERYRRLFDCSMHGMLVLCPRTMTIFEANQAFCALLEVERGAVVGQPFNELLCPGQQERFAKGIRHFHTHGQGTLADMTLSNQAGR